MMVDFEGLDIQGAYREVSIDRDCCMQGMRQAEETFSEGSVECDRSYSYWYARYKRMTSVLTSIRALIEQGCMGR
ncbi:hypothetical protein [Bacillus sp. ISL-7]|uniref:hypothetical protein n=1 Tax=Bacillus sp. ISL-7 TaxID=2819136 RepID=UPI001BE7CD99|nr:hypothetical protein [Bacillus sp. ISL-7]MBT2736143.1 hypothetical protein [Bacillus sp. ISL-7]